MACCIYELVCHGDLFVMQNLLALCRDRSQFGTLRPALEAMRQRLPPYRSSRCPIAHGQHLQRAAPDQPRPRPRPRPERGAPPPRRRSIAQFTRPSTHPVPPAWWRARFGRLRMLRRSADSASCPPGSATSLATAMTTASLRRRLRRLHQPPLRGLAYSRSFRASPPLHPSPTRSLSCCRSARAPCPRSPRARHRPARPPSPLPPPPHLPTGVAFPSPLHRRSPSSPALLSWQPPLRWPSPAWQPPWAPLPGTLPARPWAPLPETLPARPPTLSPRPHPHPHVPPPRPPPNPSSPRLRSANPQRRRSRAPQQLRRRRRRRRRRRCRSPSRRRSS